jgi:hypothetical protein
MSKSAKALALCVAGAMVLSVAVVGPAAAGDGAAAAKKGCKKGKKGADAAKKKKCKKKKKKVVPVPTPQPSPVVRATLTWDTAADVDLYMWAPDGTQSSVEGNLIPSSQFSADDTDGNGPETFSDLIAPTRQFSLVACLDDDTGLNGTIATLTYLRANGTTGTVTTGAGALDDDGDWQGVQVNPGGFSPSDDPPVC